MIAPRKFNPQPPARLLAFLILTLIIILLPREVGLDKLVYLLLLLFFLNFFINPTPAKVAKKLGALFLISLPLFLFLLALALVFPSPSPGGSLRHLTQVAWKTAVILTGTGVILLGREPGDYLTALSSFPLPHSLLFILNSAFRYSQILMVQSLASLRGKISRDTIKRPTGERMENMALVLEKIFTKVFDRSQRVYAAMLARGFDGRLIYLSRFKPGLSDIWFLIFMAAIIALIIFYW